MKPKTPKILPWLAKKAGITEHRAETLWWAAVRYATQHTGEVESPAYWQAAVDRLLELVAAESLRADAASFGWRRWSRWYARTWVAPVAAFDAFSTHCARSWYNVVMLSRLTRGSVGL